MGRDPGGRAAAHARGEPGAGRPSSWKKIEEEGGVDFPSGDGLQSWAAMGPPCAF